jgi:hypothetical protein
MIVDVIIKEDQILKRAKLNMSKLSNHKRKLPLTKGGSRRLPVKN